jgi:cysteine desulfuration protein SufE
MMLENILADFELLDDWEDRYRYVIELGRSLPPLPEAARAEANKMRGRASQVWLATDVDGAARAAPRLSFKGDSDAHIVRGLIAILFVEKDMSPSSAKRSTRADAWTRFSGSMHKTCSGVSGWPST